MAFRIGLFALVIVAMGCGDDDTDGTTALVDGGPVEMEDAAGPEPLTRTFTYTIQDENEDPLEGAYFTIDTSLGRFETVSGADGVVTLAVEYEAGDAIVFQWAMEGRVIRSVGSRDGAEPGMPFTPVTLRPMTTFVGDRTQVSHAIVDLPEGAHACFSHQGRFSLCALADEATFDVGVATAALGETGQVWVLDAAGELIDYGDAPIEGSGASRTMTFTYDGTLPAPVLESFDVSLTVPDGESSRLADAELPLRWGYWMLATDADTGRFLSVCGHATRPDPTAITARCHWVEDSESIAWSASVWSDTELSDQAGRVFRALGDTRPTGPVELIGTAMVTAGDAISDTFTIDPPEPLEVGETISQGYSLQFDNGSGVRVREHEVLDLEPELLAVPALPTDYDETVSYPFPGAGGSIRVVTFGARGARAELAPPLDIVYVSESEPRSITF